MKGSVTLCNEELTDIQNVTAQGEMQQEKTVRARTYEVQSNDVLVSWVSGKTQELEDKVQPLHLMQFRTYISSCFGCGQLLLPQDHEEGKQGHQEAVASITKHHSKEKWK